jgi:hypothetical protein
MHLVGFTIEIYHDARPYKNRISSYYAEIGNKAKGYETKLFLQLTIHQSSYFTLHEKHDR